MFVHLRLSGSFFRIVQTEQKRLVIANVVKRLFRNKCSGKPIAGNSKQSKIIKWFFKEQKLKKHLFEGTLNKSIFFFPIVKRRTKKMRTLRNKDDSGKE
jgi:hypothetical protein